MGLHRAAVLMVLVGCSTDFAPQPCAVDSDCGDGLVCELRERATGLRARRGRAADRSAQSAPISGTNQALGTGMKLGIELAFDEQNDAGGIRGRQLAARLPRRRVPAATSPRRTRARSTDAQVDRPTSRRSARRRRPADRRQHAGLDDRARRAARTRCSRCSATSARRRWCAPRRSRSRPARCSSARSPARRRSCATRRARRLREVHLQRPRELRPGSARDDRAVQEDSGVTDYKRHHLVRPERHVRPGRLRRSRRRVQGRRSARSRAAPIRRTRSLASATSRNDDTSVPAQAAAAEAYLAQHPRRPDAARQPSAS